MYGVVQWATGMVGQSSLRGILDHPELELVGVWVSDPAKQGRDAGELCGRPPTGVVATSDKKAIYDLEADVVIHTPRALPEDGLDDDVVALLESGKNAISTASYWAPLVEGPDLTARLQEAAHSGGVTLLGTGLDPGFVCDRVPAMLTGSIADIEQISMVESWDPSRHPVAEMLLDLGFGKRPEEISLDSPWTHYYAQRLFPAAVGKLGVLLGLELDEIKLDGNIEFAIAERDVVTSVGEIKAGTLSGLAYTYVGYLDGRPLIRHQWVHYVDRAGAPADWLKAPEASGGSDNPYLVAIDITGRPNLHVEMLFSDPEDPVWMPTATVAVNSVPAVCAAPPGIWYEPIVGVGRIRPRPE